MSTTNLPELRSNTGVSLVESDYTMLLDVGKFEQAQRAATLFSKSQLVPQHYRNNVADCFIALQISTRMGIEPFMFMQNSYVVHGRPGIEAKLMIALANARGPFKGSIKFEYKGEGATRSCTAWAILRENDERVEQVCSMQIAKAEGWTAKQGSKWNTMPDLMLAYRSAAFLIRLYCPEVIMGLRTVEELRDSKPDVETSAKTTELNALIAAPAEPSFDPATGEILEPERKAEKPKKKSRYLSEREPESEKEVMLNGSEEGHEEQVQLEGQEEH